MPTKAQLVRDLQMEQDRRELSDNRNQDRIQALETLLSEQSEAIIKQKLEIQKLKDMISVLEPCQRCDGKKSGSYGDVCEECHFRRLDDYCWDLGLKKYADTTYDMLLKAYKEKCESAPPSKSYFKECFEGVTRRSAPY